MSAATLRTVTLYGHLAEGIGKDIKLAFTSPARALRLLELNFPGFMIRFKEGYYRFARRLPDGTIRGIPVDAFTRGFSGDLVIVPLTRGASGKKKGLIGVVLGAIIVGAAFFFSGGTLATALPGLLGAKAGLTYGTIAKLGLAMALTGVSTVLAPDISGQSEGEDIRSFVFNGVRNLSNNGGVMPLVYGTHLADTHTVSASLDVEMLLGGFALSTLEPTFNISLERELVVVRMSDIVNAPSGATISEVDGVSTASQSSFAIDNLQITYMPATAGVEGGYDYLVLNYPSPDYARDLVISVDFKVVKNSTTFSGSFDVEVDTPAVTGSLGP